MGRAKSPLILKARGEENCEPHFKSAETEYSKVISYLLCILISGAWATNALDRMDLAFEK